MIIRLFIISLFFTLCACSEPEKKSQAIERLEHVEKLLDAISKEDVTIAKKSLDYLKNVDSSNEYLFNIEQVMYNNAVVTKLQPLLDSAVYEQALLLLQTSMQAHKKTDLLDKLETQVKQFLAMQLLVNELNVTDDIQVITLLSQRAVRLGKREAQLEDVVRIFENSAQGKIFKIKHQRIVEALCDAQMDLYYAYEHDPKKEAIEGLCWKNLEKQQNLSSVKCDKIFYNTQSTHHP